MKKYISLLIIFCTILINNCLNNYTYADSDINIYEKFKNSNMSVIFDWIYTTELYFIVENLDSNDKKLYDKLSSNIAKKFKLTWNNINDKEKIINIIWKLILLLQTKIENKWYKFNMLSEKNQHIIIVINTYLWELRKKIWITSANISSEILAYELVNTDDSYKSTYNWIPYVTTWTISLTSDFKVIWNNWDKWEALAYLQPIIKDWKISFDENPISWWIWDSENIAYHRYYASEWWKAQIKSIEVSKFLDNWAIEIYETYTNKSYIRYIKKIADWKVVAYEWTIKKSDFWPQVNRNVWTAQAWWISIKYDSRTTKMYIPNEYIIEDTHN